MKKILLLLIVAGVAWWYFDGSRRIDEAQVRAHYTEQLRIFTSLDKENACQGMTDDYKMELVVRGGDESMNMTADRSQACKMVTDVMESLVLIKGLSAGHLAPDVRQDYKSITLAPDGKSATVEYTNKVLIGDRLISTGRTTETLVRRMGKVLSTGGRTESRAY